MDVEHITVMDWGTTRERWARRIEGNSMSPLLEAGDVVIFEDRPAEHGHVVHAMHEDGSDTVKVLQGHGAHARLIPVNENYAEVPVDGMYIKGVAVEVQRSGPRSEKYISQYPFGLDFRG